MFFVEEPVFSAQKPEWHLSKCPVSGVHIAVPALPQSSTPDQTEELLHDLMATLIREQHIGDCAVWFYTPMAFAFAGDLQPVVTIYDCMDELSLFQGAPPALLLQEKKLFERADLVFTGGLSLFEAKCEQHRRVYPFPSSVDVAHFAQARRIEEEPADQQHIPHPRIGYAGVIDERVDTSLLAELARLRPDWQIVMLGPIVKISVDALPKSQNIHYLGMKPYSELPAYFSGWEAAMLPFALNDATRYISPTKTPEYLAAGLPVISTPIRDVVRPYGELGLASIVANPTEFAAAVDQIMTYPMGLTCRKRAGDFLSTLSWDKTWGAMNDLITAVIVERQGASSPCCAPSLRALAMEPINV